MSNKKTIITEKDNEEFRWNDAYTIIYHTLTNDDFIPAYNRNGYILRENERIKDQMLFNSFEPLTNEIHLTRAEITDSPNPGNIGVPNMRLKMFASDINRNMQMSRLHEIDHAKKATVVYNDIRGWSELEDDRMYIHAEVSGRVAPLHPDLKYMITHKWTTKQRRWLGQIFQEAFYDIVSPRKKDNYAELTKKEARLRLPQYRSKKMGFDEALEKMYTFGPFDKIETEFTLWDKLLDEDRAQLTTNVNKFVSEIRNK